MLVLCRKLHFHLAKSTKKTVAAKAALLAQIFTKSYVRWGFAPNPTGELTVLPHTS